MSALATMTLLENKGVKFRAEGSQLKWAGPEGVVHSSDVTVLRSGKWAVLAKVRINQITDPHERGAKQFQFDERAGIIEFDGNLSRADAEEQAYKEAFPC